MEREPRRKSWYENGRGAPSARGWAASAGVVLAISLGGGWAAKEIDSSSTAEEPVRQDSASKTINKLSECDPDETVIRVARDSVTEQYGQMEMCRRGEDAFVTVQTD